MALALSLFAFSTNAAETPKKPGPEIKQFSALVGKWKLEESDPASPFGPGGKGTFRTEIRFVHDGFAVEEHGKGQLSATPNTYTIVYHFDPQAHIFRSFFYDNTGSAIHAEGTFNGRTWSAHGTQEVDGKKYMTRSVMQLAADGNKFTYEWTYSVDGVTWKPMFTGTGTRVGK